MQLHDELTRYLGHLTNDRHLSPRTREGYRDELELLLRRAGALDPAAVGRFVAEGEDGQPLGPSTKNRRLVAVRGFARFLVRRGLLTEDPTAGISRAPVPRDRRVALGVVDLGRVLAVVRADRSRRRAVRDEAIVVLLFQTGLRVSELARLDVDQVDLASTVLRTVSRKGGGDVDVLLNTDARDALSAWLGVRPETEDRALFLSGRGRLSVRAIQKRLRALGKRAGLVVSLHPHRLRHAHATALLRVGTPVDVIRQSLNHSSISTTQRYLHGDEALLREALGRMPKLTRSTNENEPPEKDP